MNATRPGLDARLCLRRQLLLSDLLQTGYLLDNYKQLKTNEDRFKLVLDIIVRNSAILFDSECKHKITDHSVILRAHGNKNFKVGRYYTAVQEYTESIVYAVDSSEEQALAYANRSAALFNVEKYADCIDDIERALNLNYPDRLKTKLYKRQGICLATLGRPGADVAFQEALVWLDKMNLNEDGMNKSKSELENLISAPPAAVKQSEKLMQHPLPEIHTPNSELLSASDAVALKYSKKRGRHLVATRKIKPGELLVLEKPYCLKLLPKYVYTHCEYCLQVCWAMIPCKYCVYAAFCSDECRNQAWEKYHEIECPVVGMLRCFDVCDALWVSMRMTIMATKKGTDLNTVKQELIIVDRNIDTRTKGFSEDGKFHSDQYRSVSSLPNNADTCTLIELLSGGLWAALVICALARESTMFGKKLTLDTLTKNPDVIFAGGLMLKHVHIVWLETHCYGASQRSSAYEHGQALMALCGLTNHSCDPNTLRQWYADRMALYATYPIEQGEEILDNYGMRYITMTKSERQRYLKRQNLNCECIPCTKNWPLLSHIPSYKKQPLSQQNKNKLDEVLREFTTSIKDLVQKGALENVPYMLDKVVRMIETLFETVQRPCSELAMMVTMLTDLYASADTIFEYLPIRPSGIEIQSSIFLLYLEDMLAK